MSKLEKIRTHISENKKAYIIGASGVAVGAVATLGVFYGRNIVINDSLNVSVNSPKTNIVVQMVRPGPKSHAIQCVETQEVWPSIRQAAESLGIDRGSLGKHLKGEFSDVAGLSFTKVAEL